MSLLLLLLLLSKQRYACHLQYEIMHSKKRISFTIMHWMHVVYFSIFNQKPIQTHVENLKFTSLTAEYGNGMQVVQMRKKTPENLK